MTAFYWFMEYFISFLESFLAFTFCGAFLKNKKSVLNKYLYAIISLVVAACTILLGNIKLFSAVNTVIVFVSVWLIQCLIYKANVFKTLGIVISYFATIFICDVMITSIVAILTNSSVSNVFNGFSFGRVVAALGSKGILAVTCMTTQRITGRKKFLSNGEYILCSLASIVLIIISAAIYFTQAKSYSDNVNFMMMLFFIVMLILILTLFFCIMSVFDTKKKEQELALIEQSNQNLKRSMKELETSFSMWRKSVHDYKNTVFAISTMIKQGKVEEVSDYLDTEIENFQNDSTYIKTGNMTADTILNAKYAMANSQGIHMTVNVALPEHPGISDIDLAAVIGNLLDNAIEAQKGEDEPYIHVQIGTIKSFFLIKILNRYTPQLMTNDTTKEDKSFHGIGLKSVHSIMERYNGLFTLEQEDNTVVAKVMIPMK